MTAATGVASTERHRGPRSLALAAVLVVKLVSLPLTHLVVRAGGASSSSWDLVLRSRTVYLAATTTPPRAVEELHPANPRSPDHGLVDEHRVRPSERVDLVVVTDVWE